MAANDSRRYGISPVAKQTESDVMVKDVNVKEVAKIFGMPKSEENFGEKAEKMLRRVEKGNITKREGSSLYLQEYL